jgi:glutamate-1-semialdehyde 2,1-aminomutase
MFQYYLRVEGLALSWVGSGRLIFSHNFSDQDFLAVMNRFVAAAAAAMKADGWWWHHPSSSNKSIKRQLLRELLTNGVKLGWTRRPGRNCRDPGAMEGGRKITSL